jgi:hypothetical protein
MAQNHENMAKMIEHRDAMTPEQGDSENYHFRI